MVEHLEIMGEKPQANCIWEGTWQDLLNLDRYTRDVLANMRRLPEVESLGAIYKKIPI